MRTHIPPKMHICTHKEARIVPKCWDREKNPESGHKAKLALARGGPSTERFEGREAGDPEMQAGSPSACPQVFQSVPGRNWEAWEM